MRNSTCCGVFQTHAVSCWRMMARKWWKKKIYGKQYILHWNKTKEKRIITHPENAMKKNDVHRQEGTPMPPRTEDCLKVARQEKTENKIEKTRIGNRPFQKLMGRRKSRLQAWTAKRHVPRRNQYSLIKISLPALCVCRNGSEAAENALVQAQLQK